MGGVFLLLRAKDAQKCVGGVLSTLDETAKKPSAFRRRSVVIAPNSVWGHRQCPPLPSTIDRGHRIK